jgi:hypothetical protein
MCIDQGDNELSSLEVNAIKNQLISFIIVHSLVCGGARPVLWERVRAGLGVQFPQSLPNSRRDGHRRRGHGDQQAHHQPRTQTHRLLRLKQTHTHI